MKCAKCEMKVQESAICFFFSNLSLNIHLDSSETFTCSFWTQKSIELAFLLDYDCLVVFAFIFLSDKVVVFFSFYYYFIIIVCVGQIGLRVPKLWG